MIIVIEGSNCVGKTTICKQLAKKIRYSYVHFPTRAGDKFPGIDTTYGELFRSTGEQRYAKIDIEINLPAVEAVGNVVVDRMWLSHYVYSQSNFQEYPYYTVILHGSEDLLVERFKNRIKDCDYTNNNRESILGQIIYHNQKFIEMGTQHNIPMINIDDLSVDDILNMF